MQYIQNNQDMKTIQVFANKWMDKDEVDLYNGILFSYE